MDTTIAIRIHAVIVMGIVIVDLATVAAVVVAEDGRRTRSPVAVLVEDVHRIRLAGEQPLVAAVLAGPVNTSRGAV